MGITRHRPLAEPRPLEGSLAQRAHFVALLLILILCLIGGGASRPDVLSLLYLRPALVLCAALILVTPGPFDFRTLRTLLLMLAALAGLMALQLVPLPPEVWQSLPGRDRYVEAAQAAGFPQPWRPISLTPDLTWNSLIALLVPFAVLLGMAPLRRDQVHALLYVLIGFSCISAILGLAQLGSGEQSSLFLYSITHSGSAVGFFANRNHQATLLAMTFPLLRVWTLLPHPNPQWRRARYWIAVGIGIFLVPMILTTGSRAGAFLGLLGLAGALLVSPPTREERAGEPRRRGWQRAGIAALLAAPVVMTVIVLIFGRAVAIQRLISPEGFADERRFGEMPTMIRMVIEFSPVGTGFGSFDPVFRGFESDASLDPRYFNHAHNDVVELALTGGFPALALLAAFILWWLYRSFAAFRPYRNYRSEVLFARAGALVILILFLASLVDYPLRTPFMAMVFTIAAVWLARGRLAGPANSA